MVDGRGLDRVNDHFIYHAKEMATEGKGHT